MGTYTTSGSTFTTTQSDDAGTAAPNPSRVPYCVQGNTLYVVGTSPADAGVMGSIAAGFVATKQ